MTDRLMGFGTRNAEGEKVLEFGVAVGMAVCNTFFTKEDSKLITYQSGDIRNMIDYLMVSKTDRIVVDVKVFQVKSVSHSIEWLLVDWLYP